MSINKQNARVRKKEVNQSLAEDIVNNLRIHLSGMDGIRKLTATVILALEEKDKPLGERLGQLYCYIEKDNDPESSLDNSPIFKEWFSVVMTYRKEEALFRMSVLILTAAIYDYFIGSVFDSLYNHFPWWGSKEKKQLEEKYFFKSLSIDEKKVKIADEARNKFTSWSRIDQVRYLDKKLRSNIEANYSRLNDFIEVAARRNLYVHTGGVISKKYKDICKRNNVDFELEEHEKITGFLFANNEYIDNAIDCYFELSFIVAHEIVIQAHPKYYLLLFKAFTDGIFQAIKEERWDLAESLCSYLLKTSPNLPSEAANITMTYLCLVKKVNAKKYEAELDNINRDKKDHLVQHLEEKAFETLKEERWQVAEYLYEFILHFQDLICYQGDRNFLIINLCIAKKFVGKPFMEIIESCDWSKEGREYEFAVAVLNDNYNEAVLFMKDEYIQNKIGETEYLIWPLFREFRKSSEFLTAYKEIMGKEFASTSS